jgi:protein involved in polysaccharide export with SLBB domain
MKKIILLPVILLAVSAFSQELDTAYLESLPESVREGVLGQIDSRKDADKPIYRRPSTMIKKNYCDEDLLNRNERIEESFNYESKQGVDNYQNNNNECIPRSDRFGSKFFNMMQSSFMPVNEPNFDSSYILDFGDTLEIHVTSQKNTISQLDIKRDGSINIPNVGKIFIAGLSLKTANEVIKNKVANIIIGAEAYVTLVEVRDIQILITGNAFNPGIYTLNGNSNVLHALSMAGGIDDEVGSYRRIDLIRDNEIINTFDLYDIFIHGKSQYSQRLRSGDSLLIRPSINLVSISGAVKRPGTYELKNNESFFDLFSFGNGFSDSANKETLRIERLENEDVKYFKVDDIDSLVSFIPKPGDRLNVRAYERKRVKITGAVNTPGTYAISTGETLSSLIIKAEGYKDNAYPFAGILNNKKALELNEKAVEKLYTTFVQKLMTKGDPLFQSEALPFALKELKKSDTSGRIMAEFDLSILETNPSLDTILDDGDEIIIPIKTQQVYIFGQINNDGAIRYMPGQGIRDYIARSGGITENADYNYVYVVHPNGEVNRVSNSRIPFLNNRSNDILIYPGSVIYVPRKVNSQEAALVAAIWAPIVSAMATSITALSVLNNN